MPRKKVVAPVEDEQPIILKSTQHNLAGSKRVKVDTDIEYTRKKNKWAANIVSMRQYLAMWQQGFLALGVESIYKNTFKLLKIWQDVQDIGQLEKGGLSLGIWSNMYQQIKKSLERE